MCGNVWCVMHEERMRTRQKTPLQQDAKSGLFARIRIIYGVHAHGSRVMGKHRSQEDRFIMR